MQYHFVTKQEIWTIVFGGKSSCKHSKVPKSHTRHNYKISIIKKTIINIFTSYWLSFRGPYCKFFLLQFMALAPSMLATNWRQNRGSVAYTVDWEDEFSNLRYLLTSLLRVCWVREWFLLTQNGYKLLTHVKSKTSQFEIIN